MDTFDYLYLAVGIKKLTYHKKEFMIIDYSNTRENEMINRINILSDLIKHDQTPVYVIAIFNDRSFVTPIFLRHTERITTELRPLILNKALVGLNAPKKMILQGQNAKAKTDIKSFDSVEEAVDDLLTQPPLDHSVSSRKVDKKLL